jgi:L-threonylcarbamoyladenylate synthase
MNGHLSLVQNGNWVMEAGITGWSLVFDPFKLSVPLPAELGSAQKQDAYLLLHAIDVLSMFSMQIPDVAWDLLDFAEKPLIIVLKGVKNLPEPYSGSERYLGYAKLHDDPISDLVKSYKRPLMVLPLSGNFAQPSEVLPPWAGSVSPHTISRQVQDYKVYALGSHGLLQRLKG